MSLHRIAAAVFLLTASACALAQSDLIIDDFTSGHYQSSPILAGNTGSSLQVGHMIGGSRNTFFSAEYGTLNGANLNFNQPSSYGMYVKNAQNQGGLVQSGGFATSTQMAVEYGATKPLDADFAPYDRVRINFYALSQPIQLIFDVASLHPDAYGEESCSLAANAQSFSVEVPFSQLNLSTGFDFEHVAAAVFVFNTTTSTGANFAVKSIELSDHSASGAITCPKQ